MKRIPLKNIKAERMPNDYMPAVHQHTPEKEASDPCRHSFMLSPSSLRQSDDKSLTEDCKGMKLRLRSNALFFFWSVLFCSTVEYYYRAKAQFLVCTCTYKCQPKLSMNMNTKCSVQCLSISPPNPIHQSCLETRMICFKSEQEARNWYLFNILNGLSTHRRWFHA